MAGHDRPALRLESVSLPVNAFTGEPFVIDLAVSAPRKTQAEVELSAEGRSLGTTTVALNAGVNPIRMQANIETPGALDLSIAVRTKGADVACRSGSDAAPPQSAVCFRRPAEYR